MSRQTIFAYLPEDERAKQVLSVAATLARRDQSHLIGAYVIPPIKIYPMMVELPQAVYDDHLQVHRDHAKAMQAQFDDTTSGDDFVAEWRVLEAGASTMTDALMDHVRCADMIVAPHYGPQDTPSLASDVGETLAMESGRPVLMLPKHMRTEAIGEHIAIAWDGSRESVRAVFDSIGLLKGAKSVRILSVGDTSRGKNTMLPAAEMAATLTRRGIACEADHVSPGGQSIGDAILGRIGDMGNDLLVMGVYGHSKLREFVFGGVTRHILHHMTVPVMMSR